MSDKIRHSDIESLAQWAVEQMDGDELMEWAQYGMETYYKEQPAAYKTDLALQEEIEN